MDKNSIIGFILIALILFGFTFYESGQSRKRAEAQRQLDSIAMANMPVDTVVIPGAAAATASMPESPAEQGSIYTDSMLEEAHNAESSIATLENELVKLEFTTKGAQPYSAQLKKYSSYGGGELFLFKEGNAEYAISIYTGQYIRTTDFNFTLAENSDTSGAQHPVVRGHAGHHSPQRGFVRHRLQRNRSPHGEGLQERVTVFQARLLLRG